MACQQQNSSQTLRKTLWLLSTTSTVMQQKLLKLIELSKLTVVTINFQSFLLLKASMKKEMVANRFVIIQKFSSSSEILEMQRLTKL